MKNLYNLWHRFWNWLLGRKSETTYSSTPSSVQPTQSSPISPYAPPISSLSLETAPTPPLVHEPQLDLASHDEPQYELWPSLMTPREREFYKLLLEAVGDRYQIFSKVRLGDILKLSNEPRDRKFHSNQLQCKHFDFLLCEKDWYKPVLAIELDDNSHKRPDHRARDEFKDRVCQQAHLKLWRPPIQRSYARNYIHQEIQRRISQS